MKKFASVLPGLRYAADCRSLFFLGIQTAVTIGLWTGRLRSLALWWVLAWLTACAANVKHNHMHRRMFRATWANLLLDHWLGLLTGATSTSIITEHNLRHHGHNNTKDDFVRASLVSFRSQWLNFFLFCPRAWWELYFQKPLDLKLWWKTKRSLFWRSLAEQISLWGVFGVLFAINWRATLLFIFLPWLHGQWWLITFNLLQHQSLAADDPWSNSRNLVGRGFNFFFFNVGFHTAHHLCPSLHWSELPSYHARTIAPRIDPRLVSPTLWRFYADWFSHRSLPNTTPQLS